MSSESRMKQFLLAIITVAAVSALTACGGSSSNVSPGKEIIPPEATPTPTPTPIPTLPPVSGITASVIPASLGNAIYDSGETAPNGKPIYIIDVSALPGGALDPTGLLLGNDYIFRIEGGALRITQN